MKPMLLPQQPLRIEDLTEGQSYYIQPKYDGIRLTIDPLDGIRTRSGKRIPAAWLNSQLWNTYLRSPWYTDRFLYGNPLDGEILFWNTLTDWWDPFNSVQSVVMSKSGPDDYAAKAWRFVIFDQLLDRVTFRARWDNLSRACVKFETRLILSEMEFATSPFEVDVKARSFVDAGFEGAVVRLANGWYRQGRATYNSGIIFKYVDWVREEAEIVGFEELNNNIDTSSTKVDNMIPANTLGALIVRSSHFGQFNIGTGFSAEVRQDLWNRREWLIGSVVTFKYRPGHIKDAPCPAVYVGIREEE